MDVKAFREAKGWTQEQLAEVIGYSSGHISKIENGCRKPSIRFLRRCATTDAGRLSFCGRLSAMPRKLRQWNRPIWVIGPECDVCTNAFLLLPARIVFAVDGTVRVTATEGDFVCPVCDGTAVKDREQVFSLEMLVESAEGVLDAEKPPEGGS